MKKAAILLVTFGGLLVAAVAWHVITDVRGVTSSKRSTQATMPFLQLGLQLYVHEYGALPETTENPTLFKILTGANPLKLSFCSATEAEHAAGQFWTAGSAPMFFRKPPAI